MCGTDGCPRQKDRILPNQGNCSRLYGITRGLNIIQLLKNVKDDGLGLWTSMGENSAQNRDDERAAAHLGLD
jgi:hypothetical protein